MCPNSSRSGNYVIHGPSETRKPAPERGPRKEGNTCLRLEKKSTSGSRRHQDRADGRSLPSPDVRARLTYGDQRSPSSATAGSRTPTSPATPNTQASSTQIRKAGERGHRRPQERNINGAEGTDQGEREHRDRDGRITLEQKVGRPRIKRELHAQNLNLNRGHGRL